MFRKQPILSDRGSAYQENFERAFRTLVDFEGGKHIQGLVWGLTVKSRTTVLDSIFRDTSAI